MIQLRTNDRPSLYQHGSRILESLGHKTSQYLGTTSQMFEIDHECVCVVKLCKAHAMMQLQKPTSIIVFLLILT